VPARNIVIWSLLTLLAACDKASLPTPPEATARAAPAVPAPVPETGKPSPALQQQCDREARDWYEHQHAWLDFPNSPGVHIVSTYANHYSAKFNRCYAVVDRSTSNTDAKTGAVTHLRSSTLADVLANRDIGTANWFGSNDAFNQCQVNGTACLSGEEWIALVRPYLEE
jgi:hypothetical protein